LKFLWKNIYNISPVPYCSQLSSVLFLRCFLMFIMHNICSVHHIYFYYYVPMTYGLLCMCFPLCAFYFILSSYCSTYVWYVQINTTYLSHIAITCLQGVPMKTMPRKYFITSVIVADFFIKFIAFTGKGFRPYTCM